MFFSNEKDNNLLYEIDINIKAYTKITEKDKERINYKENQLPYPTITQKDEEDDSDYEIYPIG